MKMTKMTKILDERNTVCYDLTNDYSVNIP